MYVAEKIIRPHLTFSTPLVEVSEEGTEHTHTATLARDFLIYVVYIYNLGSPIKVRQTLFLFSLSRNLTTPEVCLLSSASTERLSRYLSLKSSLSSCFACHDAQLMLLR